MTKKVSVYVPSYNSGQYLERCLSSITRQTYPIDEIIVVDDGSTDGSSSLALKFPVRLVKNKTNEGIAASRNKAAKLARSPLLASIDADCLLEPTWLQRCIDNFGNDNIAAVGGRLEDCARGGIVGLWRSIHLKHHWGDVRWSMVWTV